MFSLTLNEALPVKTRLPGPSPSFSFTLPMTPSFDPSSPGNQVS